MNSFLSASTLARLTLLLAVAACTVRDHADDVVARADSILIASAAARSNGDAPEEASETSPGEMAPPARSLPASRVQRQLSPLADSLSRRLVFLTYGQRAFVAAGRASRLLVDLGRVDHRVESAAERAAYQEVVAALSPIRVGDRFRISAAWGREDAEVTGFDVWSGRIVAVLRASPAADAAVRGRAPVVALAVRADSASPAERERCVRSPAIGQQRLSEVRDSLMALVSEDSTALAPALRRSIRTQASHVHGCFDYAATLMIVSLVAGNHDHVRQQVVLLRPDGDVVPVRIRDRRFKTHEALHALDLDGDGVDDVAVRGRARGVGGTVVLRFDPKHRLLDWAAGGFGWEG